MTQHTTPHNHTELSKSWNKLYEDQSPGPETVAVISCLRYS